MNQRSPEFPSASLQNVKSEHEIGDCMGQYTLGNTSGAIEKDVVTYTSHNAGKPEIVFKPEHDCTD